MAFTFTITMPVKTDFEGGCALIGMTPQEFLKQAVGERIMEKRRADALAEIPDVTTPDDNDFIVTV